MNTCPECGSESIFVIDSRIATGGRRRRRLSCINCDHRWTHWSDQGEFIPRPSGRPPTQFTADQVREILTRRDISVVALARQMRCARSSIWKIRRGVILRDLAPDVPRLGKALSCRNCQHIRPGNRCAMGQPDLAMEGPSFAADCDFYDEVRQQDGHHDQAA